MLTGAQQLISLLVASFVWTLTGLTEAGAAASLTEALTVTSDNPNVLTVTKNADGTYTVDVVSAGTANLVVVTAEDTVNGIPAITESFPFEVYDPTTVATHFSSAISNIVDKPAATPAAEPGSQGTVASAT